MTADIIQARYDELDTLATRFGQQAELTANLDAQVRRCLQALEHGGWEGKGSAAFITEMYGTLLPANERLRLALDDARAVSLEVKAIYQQAEQEAAAVFGKGTASSGGQGGSFTDGGGTSSGGGKGGADGHGEPTSLEKANQEATQMVIDLLPWAKTSWVLGTGYAFLTEEPSGRGRVHDLVKFGITNTITSIPHPWVQGAVFLNHAVQLGGHLAGAAGYTDVENFTEHIDLNKGLDWVVEQEMERWEDGGVRGLVRRGALMAAGPVGMSEMITSDAVQIVGGKLLHIHGIENLDLTN